MDRDISMVSCWFWFVSHSLFTSAGADAFGQAQDVIVPFPHVAYLVHVTADELNSPSARCILRTSRCRARDGRRGVEGRTRVAQFDEENVGPMLERDTETASGIAL